MKKTLSHLVITIFMCGDVMTGRGIDQILPYPGNPRLYEPFVRDARRYVDLAEEVNGPISRPVDVAYIWGGALDEFRRVAPDVRIINLETAVTKSPDFWPGKGINYRMHPRNIPFITAADIDVAVLANNHVLDWGYSGLEETLDTLNKAKLKTAGAGRSRKEAKAPAVVEVADKGRVLVFAFGAESSGVPSSWGASEDGPGINFLKDFSDQTVRQIQKNVASLKETGDIVIASIHWGGNWGFKVPRKQIEFAHELIDEAGVDVIYGHSSHHIKGIEVYKGKPILYGCGDFINDYEGIGGYEQYRGDLSLMYFVRLDPSTGKLAELQMSPMQMKRFKVNRASQSDALWLKDTLTREGKAFGTWAELGEDGALRLRWE